MSHLPCRIAGLAVLLSLATSCGGADTHDSMSDESIEIMKEMATIIEGITDKATAEAARPDLAALSIKMKGLRDRIEALGEPDPRTQARLGQKINEAMTDTNLMASIMKLAAMPEAVAVLNDVMQDLSPGK